MTQPSDFYLKLVEASGLSAIFAEQTIGRVCARISVKAEDLAPRHLRRLMPALEEALAVFLPREELGPALERIRALSPPDSRPRSLSLEGDDEEEELTLQERVAAAFARGAKPNSQ